ncbi:MAG: hypothetical protein EOP50_00900 [Sphingobacteriales bacterium]|nr:MAG: hypothetical protein EOP50_00900 [Sphingobacteriales bacterium]
MPYTVKRYPRNVQDAPAVATIPNFDAVSGQAPAGLERHGSWVFDPVSQKIYQNYFGDWVIYNGQGTQPLEYFERSDSHTLVAEDFGAHNQGSIINLLGGGSPGVKVPPASAVALPLLVPITFYWGAGAQPEFVPDHVSVTIISANSSRKLRVLNSAATLVQLTQNNWLLTGDITA